MADFNGETLLLPTTGWVDPLEAQQQGDGQQLNLGGATIGTTKLPFFRLFNLGLDGE